MPRTTGAKNVPKTTEQLELELLQRYAAKGDKKPAEKKAPAKEPAKKSGKKLELAPTTEQTKGEEKDTYTCGSCHGKLDSELARCPHCGVSLTW